VKYCLKNKNDPAEFTSSILGVKEADMGFGGTSNKIKSGKSD